MSCQAHESSIGIGIGKSIYCKVGPTMMWICADVEHQGGQQKQREMMSLFILFGDHRLYGNGNQDTETFLGIGVEVRRNGALIAKRKVLLEIN
jgi:hypothetical protein